MNKIKAIMILAALALGFSVAASNVANIDSASTPRIVKGHPFYPEMDEKVIVGTDTMNLVIRDRNFGRYDRGLFNYLFIPRKQWVFDLMASYGDFDAKDVEILQAVDNFNFNGKQYAIHPTVGYFFRNNQCVGLKFNYTRAEAELGGLNVNLGEDLSFSLNDISYSSNKYSMGIFYRNYVGLSRAKRFAIFNEACLSFGSGSSRFKRPYNSQIRDTRTDFTEVALNFSPGLCVFVMDAVSFNISFGVFGVHLTNEKQTTDGVEEGSRFSSGANFRFNLFNINFGIGVHI
ncbi:MAG: hypothetical protein NC338_03650 [Firmicutes bacterium]|nr:hypothetical protein [Bacillota bacterium]MCM1401334.1 hypothetical protein [Bacteroides sp.]